MRTPGDATLIEMSDQERNHLLIELSKDQILNDLSSPTMKWLMATVKRNIMLNQAAFFQGGMGLPPGLEGASPREAYCVGLVSFGRLVLGLVQELEERGHAPEPKPIKRTRDPMDFAVAEGALR